MCSKFFDTMDVREKLKMVGLSTSEVEVFLHTLKQQAVKPSDVSRETKISRTNCYNVLHQLKEKGLVREEVNQGSKSYRANSPHELSILLDRQKSIVNELIPELELINGSAVVVVENEIRLVEDGLTKILKSSNIKLFGSFDGCGDSSRPLIESFVENVRQVVNFQHLLSSQSLGSVFLLWDERLSILNLRGKLCLITIREESFKSSMLNWLKLVSRETL